MLTMFPTPAVDTIARCSSFFEASPLGDFGAELSGIDLSAPISSGIAQELRSALARFQVLVFRNQSLNPSAQEELTRCFGEFELSVSRRPQAHQIPGHPNILYLSNQPGSVTVDYGKAWHSDGLHYARTPHGATLLYCIACPTGEGQTWFANQYAAHAALPENVRQKLGDASWYLPDVLHSEVPHGRGLSQPIIRTHPETGNRFIFCSPAARQLRGMTRAESEELLKVVHASQTLEANIYRHAWKPGELVVWENCTLLHRRAAPVSFELHGLRAMHRSATTGKFSAVECEAAEV
ncbi:hypothetical protein GHV42_05370 [Xanthomonas oryzae pv. oryzicola]|nr:hypothetical protein GHV42_05370 [Xanthomonas oryzae pv. oryzicola]